MKLNSKINKLTIGGVNYNFSQEPQVGNMTGLGGIDVTKDVIYSTIDSQTNISISGECEVGKKITIVCESLTSITIKVDDSRILTSSNREVLVTSKGDVFTLEIYCIDTNKYFLINKGVNEFPFLGEVGDVVLCNSNDFSFLSVKPEKLSNFSKELYIPVGIVVISSSSGRYGESGVSSIISLEDMESGAETCWGENKLTGIRENIDGSNNTKQCLLFRGEKNYNSWYPDYSSGSDYPPATLCHRYTIFKETLNKSSKVDLECWYLPVISEFSEIDLNVVNKSIEKVSEVFLNTNVNNVIGNYWTSTEFNIDESYCYSTATGKISSEKLEKRKIRAFLKIDSNGKVIPNIIDFNAPVEFSIHVNRGEQDSSKMVKVVGSNPELLLRRFRRCMSKSSGGKSTICFLDDNDTSKFEDGTEANLVGLDGDVMVYFPEFWYLGEEVGYEYIWNISSTEKDGYYHSPASLVGAYKGVMKNNLLRSISGVTPMIDFDSSIKFMTGYNSIDYHQHCVIAWMFLARYGTTNSQSKCGKGVDPWKNGVVTGGTNNIGIRDTDLSQESINFLGLEDIWGNISEFIYGIFISKSNNSITISDPRRMSESRTLFGNVFNYNEGCIKDIISGEHMDIFPDQVSSKVGYYSDFLDSSSLNSETGLIIRSNNSVKTDNEGWSGLFSTKIIGEFNKGEKIGCRLGFEGEIEIVKHSSEYRNPSSVPVEFSIRIDRKESNPSKMVKVVGGDPELLLRRFRRCIVNKGQSENSAKIIYLNDIDSNYYSDLTSASLDGTDGDVMVYFPEFWYLGETTSDEHIWNISSTEKDGYYHSPASLVGAYKGYVSSEVLKSISGVIPTGNLSYSSFRNYSENAGEGFHIINYHQHCVIAWMFLARYGTTNSQSKCGTCKDCSSGFLPTGSTNYLGNSDTNPEISNIDSDVLVNFLGIEGCWGHLGECIDDIYYNPSGSVVVSDKHLDLTRDLVIPEISSPGTISDIYGKGHMDVFPSTALIKDYNDYYYTDLTKLVKKSSGNSHTRRSERTLSSSKLNEGVFYLVTDLRSSDVDKNLGTRLAYDGNIEVNSVLVKVTVTFKSTPSNAKIEYKIDSEVSWKTISSGGSIETVLGSTIHYRASLVGYNDYSEESKVVETVLSTINIVLQKSTDYFTIHLSRTQSDPSKIVTVDGGCDPEKLLSKFRRCLCKKVSDNNVKICYLDDNNSNQYFDGSSAKTDGAEGDVMVYFPEMWIKGETVESEHRFTISLVEQPGWRHIPHSLVGAYKGTLRKEGNYTSDLHSTSGIGSDEFDGCSKFIAAANSRGKGYHIIDYQQHCIIAWMFYARYKNTNSQKICGYGRLVDDTNLNGVTNSNGINDTVADNNLFGKVNFLGLEDCWGNINECMEGIHYSYADRAIIIYDKGNYFNQSYDSISYPYKRMINISGNMKGNITDIRGGIDMDVFPTSCSLSQQNDNYYCDYYRIVPPSDSNLVFDRSEVVNYEGDAWSGISAINYNIISNSNGYRTGTRLAFDGTIEIVDDVNTFKSLPNN